MKYYITYYIIYKILNFIQNGIFIMSNIVIMIMFKVVY